MKTTAEKEATLIVELKENNKMLLMALNAYISKFGDCGDTYKQAKQAIKKSERNGNVNI